MKDAEEIGAPGVGLNARAPSSAAQKFRRSAENQCSSAQGAVSNTDFSISHASSCGALESLQTARSIACPAKTPRAGVQGRLSLSAGATENVRAFLGGMAISLGDASVGATCNQLHVGAKRSSLLAFSGDAASTHTEPLLPYRPRLSSMSTRYGEDSVVDGRLNLFAGQGSRQPEPLPPLPHVAEQIGSASANVAMATEPTSVSSAIIAESGGSDNQLPLHLSTGSPAVLEQLLAAALAAPAQALAGRVMTSRCSPTRADDVAKRSRSFGRNEQVQHLCGEKTLIADTDPLRCWQGNLKGVTGLCTTPDAAAAGQKLPGAEVVNLGGNSGSARGSTGDASLAVTASDKGPRGSSSLGDEAADDSRGSDVDCLGQGGCSTGTKLAGDGGGVIWGTAHSGGEAAAGGIADTSGLTRLRGTCTQVAAETLDGGEANESGGGCVTGPEVGMSSAARPHQQVSPLVEPVSAQLLAALPPAVAARLKKPIRIIQPISQAWVEETLQCASGAGPQSVSGSNTRPTAASITPGSTGTALIEQLHQRGCPALAVAVAETSMAGLSRTPDGVTALAANARELPTGRREPAPRVMTPGIKTASGAVAAVPTFSAPAMPSFGWLQSPAAVEPTFADHSSQLSVLALRTALRGDENASPFTLSSVYALPPPQTESGTVGSSVAMMLAPSFGSNNTTVSTTPTTGAANSAFGSGAQPALSKPGPRHGGVSSDAPVACPSHAATAVAAGGIITTAMASSGASPVALDLDTLSACPALPAFLTSALPAGLNMAAAVAQGVAPAPSDPLLSAAATPAAAVAAALPPQAWPLLLQPSASAIASTSASCLGSVQGELTLLYQWYVANKAIYLDQAQRQLQRIEALTAARDSAAGGADAAMAACARAESAEAVRAFETARKIMSVCGRVEQQWLSTPAPPDAADHRPHSPSALMRGTSKAPAVPTAAADASLVMSLGSTGQAPSSTCPSFPADLPELATGWAHGASAALAVAAALVGSVTRGQGLVPGSGRIGFSRTPEQQAGAGPVARAGVQGGSSISVNGLGPLEAGVRPSAGLPVPLAQSGFRAAVMAAAPPRPAVAGAATPPPLRARTAPLSPPIAPRSQATVA